jgi:hypothetical protein
MNHNQKFHNPEGPAFNVGEKWISADRQGGECIINNTMKYGPDKWDVTVFYTCNNGMVYEKDAWNFQVRYFHIADINI